MSPITTEPELRRSPIWLHAITCLERDGLLVYRSEITKDHLVRLFELPTPRTAKEGERFNLRYLQCFMKLREALLLHHNLDLATVKGKGRYTILRPGEQTEAAYQDSMRGIRHELHIAALRCTNIRTAELTDAQRRENLDAIARIASLARMVKSRRALPRPPGKIANGD